MELEPGTEEELGSDSDLSDTEEVNAISVEPATNIDDTDEECLSTDVDRLGTDVE